MMIRVNRTDRIRLYKSLQGASKRLAALKAQHPDKAFAVVPSGFRYAIALMQDGKVRAICA